MNRTQGRIEAGKNILDQASRTDRVTLLDFNELHNAIKGMSEFEKMQTLIQYGAALANE